MCAPMLRTRMGRIADLLEGGHRRRRLFGILAVAFAVRCAFVLSVDVDPRTNFHFDMTFYEIAALRLTDGALLRDFDGTPTAKWSPGYPILLGGTYFLFGKNLVFGKLLNAVLATLTCGLIYGLGRRLFQPAVGLCAAMIFALLPGDILYAALHLSEVAFTTVFTGLMLLFVVLEERRPNAGPLGWLAFGACVGAARLIRGTAGLFLAVRRC
jgi:4-amino-4-deoxy-L-arabinose transferase-like glycosyltransferase